MTGNGLAAAAAAVGAVVSIALMWRGSGSWRLFGISLLVLSIGVGGFAVLEGMGAFCDPPPGGACL
jgi:hypothetical protein